LRGEVFSHGCEELYPWRVELTRTTECEISALARRVEAKRSESVRRGKFME